ncbi:unnamed protein product [Microthlaspi erraticum]|uniref:CCHC-type domain-containing protein n=1 Tax=Microthlaspi erraticum TaxID=1685480 RepID=A0A6D2KLW4_9BRAS|nr:unnamed protein product [Microthlaspi erraticum]
MSNLTKLEIAALNISGNNYLSWTVGAKLHLKGNGLLSTIDKSGKTSDEQKAKAMIFFRHHIHDGLKDEYITKEDHADLWNSLKVRSVQLDLPFPEANVASSSHTKKPERERRRGRGRGRGRGRESDDGRAVKRKGERTCYRCGMNNHFERTCRTPKHLADLYRASQQAKNKDTETNFISDEPGPSFDGLSDDFHLDVADYLVDLKNQLSQRKSNR